MQHNKPAALHHINHCVCACVCVCVCVYFCSSVLLGARGIWPNATWAKQPNPQTTQHTGWVNSFADIKRKFASFVKLNLSNNVTGASGTGTTTAGDRLTLKEKHLQQVFVPC